MTRISLEKKTGSRIRRPLQLWCGLYLLVNILTASVSLMAQSYEGKWNRTYLQFSVQVESWGNDCGTKPRSYSSKSVKPTEILENKGHLFFSKGGLRTDRCNSPNPNLVTITASRSANMWTRTCETAPNASRYEKIDSTFSGTGNKLTYRAESSFRWSLNGDLCLVQWVERRIYERDGVKENGLQNSGSPILKVHEDDSFSRGADGLVQPECTSPGSVKKLIIAPQEVQISPSEKVCFQLRGVDTNGCRFSVSAKWSAEQNGIQQNQLINKKGCFVAGDNAAETEGIYQINAIYKDVSVNTTVEVAYPDFGDLALARLDLSDELGASEEQQPVVARDGRDTAASVPKVATTPGTGETSPDISISATGVSKSSFPGWLPWVLVVAVVLLSGLVISLVVFILKRRNTSDFEDFDDEPERGSTYDHVDGNKLRQQPMEKICPQCGTFYASDAKYCPADATALVMYNPDRHALVRESFRSKPGMICPLCNRGYETGAKFCPHDSAALVEYKK
ncbi:MAG: zinc ribbon domain-containing protein [Deltaproteobacteria bacterium]|nr:zinc ribbon domain-containing protein [Deltaproteobacteria bacterium]